MGWIVIHDFDSIFGEEVILFMFNSNVRVFMLTSIQILTICNKDVLSFSPKNSLKNVKANIFATLIRFKNTYRTILLDLSTNF